MSERRLDAALATAFGAITTLLLLATRAQEMTGDSLAYAHAIRSGVRLLHPHHLLFSPIVRAIYLPLSTLHGGFDAILAGQLHNVAWAVAAVLSVYGIVVHGSGSRLLGVAAAISLLACRGFAVFATQVEVYVPAAGCAALLLLALVREAGPWLLAGLLALLVFYHQPNVLFCIPLLVFLAWRGERTRLRRGVHAVALAGILVLAAYVAAYLLEDGAASPAGFVDYTRRYAVGSFSPQWGTAENVGGGGVAALLDSQAWNLVQTASAGASRVAVGVLLAALVSWSAWRVKRGRDEALRAALVAWLLLYGAFFLWWLPGQHEFFVITLVPIVLLLTLVLDDARRLMPQGRTGSVLAAGLLAVSAGLVLPRHVRGSLLPAHRTRGAVFEIARETFEAAPGCVHINGRQVIQALRYYFDLDPAETLNVKLCRRTFVRPEPGIVLDPLPRDRCLAVPLSEVQPPGAGRGRVHDDALGWFDYYRWLFRVEPRGERLAAGPVVLRPLATGPVLLIQQGPPAEFDGMSGFFASPGASGDAPLGALGAWLERSRETLRERVDPPWLGAAR